MKNIYQRFRTFNKNICLCIADNLFYNRIDSEPVYERLPYMWIFILFPIIGFMFVVCPVEDAEYNRFRKELNNRRNKLKYE
jgi:hypothetical protein